MSVATAAIACPRCGAEVRGEQDWCVECGLAARTRMAPMPDWRLPTLAAGGIGLLALVALIVAFAVLTSHNQTVAPSTAPVTPAPAPDTAAAVAPTATAPAATTPPPAATTPPPATPAPAASTPTPTPAP